MIKSGTIFPLVVVVFSYLGFSVIIIFECLILEVFYDIIKVTQISVHHRKAVFSMNNFLVSEIEQIVKSAADKEPNPALFSVIYCLGRDVETEEEYDYAFSKLLELYEMGDDAVKARVIQAFALLAVLKQDIKILDRSTVEPLILSACSCATGANKEIIQDAIDDINYILRWKL